MNRLIEIEHYKGAIIFQCKNSCSNISYAIYITDGDLDLFNIASIQACRNIIDMHIPDKFMKICAHFGCKNVLTLMESLAGKLCTGHMNVKKIDVTKVIKL